MQCVECGCELSPENFNEVEKIKTGEIVTICNEDYNKMVENGRLEVTDKDGNYTCGDLHIFKGTNREIHVYPYPCPNCGTSVSYLGIYIPTVSVLTADYYPASFQCHNLNCDPVYEKIETEDDEGNEIIYYDLVDSGAYWSSDDSCFYTPQYPRDD